ncbi:MAG: hypothetical protein BRC29_01765 [Nanohaloarchaea archaeon SW_7_43_1]|nr:MAG: hypothetical protein BRC29_01765 [Nanohaloarchaea archaeon SW_7_43_1]
MKQVPEKDITEAVKQFDYKNQINEKEDISGHNNRIFKVKLEDKTVICKSCVGTKPKQDCRKEVGMNQLLKRRTSVKTPELLYSNPSTDKTEYPFFITEYIDGKSLQDSFPELNAENQVEIVEQAGQILGEVHSEISFQHAGELKPENEGIKVDRESNWIEYIVEELNQAIEKAEDTRFKDLTGKADNVVAKLSQLEEPEKTLVFYDFRPDNVITEDGKIKALIDFERAWSGDPLWDYAYSEMSFVEPYHYFTMHKPRKAGDAELREVFQKGYEQEEQLGTGWRRKVKLYKLGIIIKGFITFKGFTEGMEMSEEEINRQEKLLRTAFGRLFESV